MKKYSNVFLLICLGALVLAGCGGNVVLDNPRAEGVVFSFDGSDDYALAAGEMKTISLSEGPHAIVVKSNGGQVLGDTTFNLKEKGLVHSGSSGYVVWRQLYGVQKDRKTLLNEDWTMVDSTRYFGDIKIYPATWLYLESNWDLGLDQPLPESTTLYVTKDYKIESKVFRETEFVTTYKAMSEKAKKSQQ